MSTTIQTSPPMPEVEYPDSDGMPMSDNTLQFKWIVVIKEGLEIAFRQDPDVFVAGDLLWYPVLGNPKIRMAPDALVAFGRPKGRRGSYKQWEEGGIAPQVVFEVLSPGNRPAAMGLKLEFYEKYGVEEYYIYDPDDGDLIGYLRQGDKLVKIPDIDGFTSPRLGVRFEPGEGDDNLTLIGPDGEPFSTFPDLVDQRNAARLRAHDSERLRAEAQRQAAEAQHQAAEAQRQAAEAQRQAAKAQRQAAEADQKAEAERRRAELLAAKLREMGIEPD